MAAEAERQRVVIEGVEPEIDGGRFPIKRVVGERVTVEADAFADGHDSVCCVLLWRPEPAGEAVGEASATSADWREVPMQALGNDRWRGEFTVSALGRYVSRNDRDASRLLGHFIDLNQRKIRRARRSRGASELEFEFLRHGLGPKRPGYVGRHYLHAEPARGIFGERRS